MHKLYLAITVVALIFVIWMVIDNTEQNNKIPSNINDRRQLSCSPKQEGLTELQAAQVHGGYAFEKQFDYNNYINDNQFTDQDSNHGIYKGSKMDKVFKMIKRNRMNNQKTCHKYSMCVNPNKSLVRDIDDELGDILYAPISNVKCKYFDETDTYKKSMLKHDDYDTVDRINQFRDSNQQEYIGKNIQDIYDDLNGNNIRESVDLLAHEGTMYNKANKNFRTINNSRWYYDNENSMNGGKFAGNLLGFDSEASSQAALL